MIQLQKGAHTQYDIQYHIVWITKYRRKILTGKNCFKITSATDARMRCKRNNGNKREYTARLCTFTDKCTPSLSVAQIMQYIKGRSSKKMQEEFNSIRRQFWGQHMWATGYFCRTVGTITKEMSKELNINEVGVGLEINI